MYKIITIVGNGSWATALVKLFSDNGVKVWWVVRNQDFINFFNANGYNPKYLSYATLKTELIECTIDHVEAIANSEIILLAVPSAYLKDVLEKIDKDSTEGIPVIVSIKGIVPGTGCTPSRYVQEYFGKDVMEVIVFGGPCHAEEIVHQKSTYVTVSGKNPVLVQKLSNSICNQYIHTISSHDPVGIEYAAILKNIIGIASGVSNGLHYGDNFQAVLISNSMREAECFIESMEPAKRDLFQSAYFGDLLVTAYSDYSRNRTLGKLVGRGLHVNKAIQSSEMIAEGFYASRELAPMVKRSNLNLPVINTVYRILHQHSNPYHEFKLLEKQLT
jgi:glycerol-3-phosphate dehydrogenase (NAD(P)+)